MRISMGDLHAEQVQIGDRIVTDGEEAREALRARGVDVRDVVLADDEQRKDGR